MTIVLLIASLLVLLMVLIGQKRKRKIIEERTVTSNDALEAWRNGDFFVDVRTPKEYDEGHVPGALLIPLMELKARMNEIPKERTVFLFCRSGNRSANATLTLIKHQYSNVYNVSGGILEWKGPIQK